MFDLDIDSGHLWHQINRKWEGARAIRLVEDAAQIDESNRHRRRAKCCLLLVIFPSGVSHEPRRPKVRSSPPRLSSHSAEPKFWIHSFPEFRGAWNVVQIGER